MLLQEAVLWKQKWQLRKEFELFLLNVYPGLAQKYSALRYKKLQEKLGTIEKVNKGDKTWQDTQKVQLDIR